MRTRELTHGKPNPQGVGKPGNRAGMDPDTKSYTYSRHPGVIKHGKDSDKWEISLSTAEKILSRS